MITSRSDEACFSVKNGTRTNSIAARDSQFGPVYRNTLYRLKHDDQPLRPHRRQGAGVETGRNHYDRLRTQEAEEGRGLHATPGSASSRKRLDTRVQGRTARTAATGTGIGIDVNCAEWWIASRGSLRCRMNGARAPRADRVITPPTVDQSPARHLTRGPRVLKDSAPRAKWSHQRIGQLGQKGAGLKRATYPLRARPGVPGRTQVAPRSKGPLTLTLLPTRFYG